jgi:hypothetical protein
LTLPISREFLAQQASRASRRTHTTTGTTLAAHGLKS